VLPGGRQVAPTWLLGPLAALLTMLVVGSATVLVACSATVPSAASASGVSASAGVGDGGARCPKPSPTTPGARDSRLPLRSLCALPSEAGQVWRTIQTGGRLSYPRDGIVFNNAEHMLPPHQRGYYHEYTVPTPGERDRGARRLITGQGHELYYTGDHYASFVVVDPTAVGSG
jgi:ribonuclease T1